MCESFRRFKESAINEGVAKGEIKGEIKTLIQQLNHKLGKLSENIVEKIQNSSKEQLDQLVIKVFEIQSQDDINEILA